MEWSGLHYRVVDTSFTYIDIHIDRCINIYMYLYTGVICDLIKYLVHILGMAGFIDSIIGQLITLRGQDSVIRSLADLPHPPLPPRSFSSTSFLLLPIIYCLFPFSLLYKVRVLLEASSSDQYSIGPTPVPTRPRSPDDPCRLGSCLLFPRPPQAFLGDGTWVIQRSCNHGIVHGRPGANLLW